jgi:hypothetical protein
MIYKNFWGDQLLRPSLKLSTDTLFFLMFKGDCNPSSLQELMEKA